MNKQLKIKIMKSKNYQKKNHLLIMLKKKVKKDLKKKYQGWIRVILMKLIL